MHSRRKTMDEKRRRELADEHWNCVEIAGVRPRNNMSDLVMAAISQAVAEETEGLRRRLAEAEARVEAAADYIWRQAEDFQERASMASGGIGILWSGRAKEARALLATLTATPGGGGAVGAWRVVAGGSGDSRGRAYDRGGLLFAAAAGFALGVAVMMAAAPFFFVGVTP